VAENRPFAIHGGRFGTAARSWADALRTAVNGPQEPPPTYEEVMAETTRKALATPPPNDHQFEIHGGKFGTASRAFADATADKVNEYGKNWQQGNDVLLDMIYRVLQRYR